MVEKFEADITNSLLVDTGLAPKDVGENDGGISYNLQIDRKNANPNLKSVSGKVTTFSKMKTNSTVSGILLAFTAICQTPKVTVNENREDPDEKRAKDRAKFLTECLGDMQTPFSDVRGEILDMIPMGFRVMVPQFKARTGHDRDHMFNSKYSDGKIGWKNFTPIDPETIESWHTPEGAGYLGLTGISQRINRVSKPSPIPRNRMLLFRTCASNNSPIGKSLLEGAYEDWSDLIDANKIQMVGLRRSLEGIPFNRIHTKVAKAANNKDKAALAAVRSANQAVKDIDSRKDLAFSIPADRDDKGNLLIEVGIMGSQNGGGNTRVQDAQTIIEAKVHGIARSMLAQFMTIQGKSGSYARSKTETEAFINSLRMYITQIADIFNTEAIPRLFAINGEGVSQDDSYLPTISFSELIKDDVAEFFVAIQKSIEAGIFEVTPQIQKKAAQILSVDDTGQESLLKDRIKQSKKMREEGEDESLNLDNESNSSDSTDDVPETKKDDIKDKGLKDIIEE